ncbi:MAG: class I SAM-dependent methyltransferase, partial [Chloroflexota bacterium]
AGATAIEPAAPALIAAHATRLPFRPESFDAVTCRFSIHHFSDPAGSLAAMAAALRPGGRLVIADFVRPVDEAEAALHDRLEGLRGHQYVEIFEQARLEAMLAAAGCPVAEAHATHREMRPQEWLNSPNVVPEAREPLAQLIEQFRDRGGAGMEVHQIDGESRFVRTDVTLLGVKRSAIRREDQRLSAPSPPAKPAVGGGRPRHYGQRAL